MTGKLPFNDSTFEKVFERAKTKNLSAPMPEIGTEEG
jgi:hypothetical protein